MKVQLENKIMSSFLQFVDNEIVNKGEAYTNHSSLLYPVDNMYNGYHTYAAPFKQMVADSSISGPDVMTSVYIDGVQTNMNNDDLVGINHYEGQTYFTSDKSANVISGNYAIKDFNVYLTNDPEEKVLFEEKYHIRPKTLEAVSGLAPETQTYPAVYIKNNGGDHIPFALGGVDNNRVDIRAIVLADSSFKLDAVCGILKNTHRSYVPLIENLPFSAMNAYTGVNYNYTTLSAAATGQNPLIWDVFVSKNVARGEGLNPDVFAAFVDFQLQYLWNPRA